MAIKNLDDRFFKEDEENKKIKNNEPKVEQDMFSQLEQMMGGSFELPSEFKNMASSFGFVIPSQAPKKPQKQEKKEVDTSLEYNDSLNNKINNIITKLNLINKYKVNITNKTDSLLDNLLSKLETITSNIKIEEEKEKKTFKDILANSYSLTDFFNEYEFKVNNEENLVREDLSKFTFIRLDDKELDLNNAYLLYNKNKDIDFNNVHRFLLYYPNKKYELCFLIYNNGYKFIIPNKIEIENNKYYDKSREYAKSLASLLFYEKEFNLLSLGSFYKGKLNFNDDKIIFGSFSFNNDAALFRVENGIEYDAIDIGLVIPKDFDNLLLNNLKEFINSIKDNDINLNRFKFEYDYSTNMLLLHLM